MNVGVFLVMVFVLFSCKKDPVDLGFEVNADDPITFVWNDSGGENVYRDIEFGMVYLYGRAGVLVSGVDFRGETWA